MVRFCSVPYCTTRSANSKYYDRGIKFHEFPADLKLREKWLQVIRRKDFIPQDWACVCSIHFNESDYKEGLKYKRLKTGSVPSIFPSFPSYLQPKESKERRSTKRASPNEIAKRKRKRNCSQTSTNSEENEDSVNQVLYEIIPIVEPEVCDTTPPYSTKTQTQDAWTQADGLWDKIKYLHNTIRSLNSELKKKSKIIENLTIQNNILKIQLSTLQSEIKTKDASKPKKIKKLPILTVLESEIAVQKLATNESQQLKLNAGTVASKPVGFKGKASKKSNNENKVNLPPDMSYLHPRIPRCLYPPGYRKSAITGNKKKLVLSVNHLNQVTLSDQSQVPQKVSSDRDIFSSPLIYSVPKYITKKVVEDEQLKDFLEARANDSAAVSGVAKSAAARDETELENSKLIMAEADQCPETSEYRSDSDILVVPENCIIENRGDEIIIYSTENDS